jgi:predicted dehydrogenase
VQDDKHADDKADLVSAERRRFLGAAGSGILLGGLMTTAGAGASAATSQALRWGVVGTGGIANRMAPMIAQAPTASLAAVSSRKMESARAFASEHGGAKAFDDWNAMLAWDGVDAVYIATPTSVKEDISLAAASRGKHILAEKPFASLDSLRRITQACRKHGVAFMDGTHFPHHPRTQAIREHATAHIGRAGTLHSAFQFLIPDHENIRYDTTLEPMGALGDAGWYNMRAMVEYLSPDIELHSIACVTRRNAETGAVVHASGVLQFTDESTSTFNCGFESGALVMDLRLCGARGSIVLDDFVLTRSPSSADFTLNSADGPRPVDIPSTLPAAAQMFEDFSTAAREVGRRDAWMQASERTQALLDAAWQASFQRLASPGKS